MVVSTQKHSDEPSYEPFPDKHWR